MSKRKYQGFAFDKPLIDEIKKHIEGKYQYRTVTDFVRQAVLERLEKERVIKW